MSARLEKKKLVKPKLLKGFRDILPSQMFTRERIVDTLREVFTGFGYLPLETPAIEYGEMLLGDLGVDANKQVYRFVDLEGSEVGLRFDLTVSLARVVAQYQDEIVFPFRRWQTGKVWRFDKPKKGRLREFSQFDADIVGIDSVAADVEIIELLYESFTRMGIENFVIKMNNRRLLAYLLKFLKIEDEPNRVFRVLDKLEKAGRRAVKRELMGMEMKQAFDSAFEEEAALSLTEKQADGLLEFVGIEGDLNAVEEMLCEYFDVETNCRDCPGLDEVFETLAFLRAKDLSEKHLKWDLALARGLDYYTGTVVEVVLPDKQDFGSVAGGGRYDNLVDRFSERKLPGVGVAVGIDRLMQALKDDDNTAIERRKAVFIPFFDRALVSVYSKLARELRDAGMIAEVYPGCTSLGRQLKYADRAGFAVAVIVGADEIAQGVVNIKRLWTEFAADNKETFVPQGKLLDAIRQELALFEAAAKRGADKDMPVRK